VDTDREILIVISKLKNYIRAKSGMNTAGSVAEALSDRVRSLCDQAIESARKDGRKTVMDRDIPAVGAGTPAGQAMHS
jgi:histone H3/H4